MSRGTRRTSVRLSDPYLEMLAECQRRYGTENVSDTIRRLIEFGYEAGWRRCLVCGKGLGPLLAEGISDGLCDECFETESLKVELAEGPLADRRLRAMSPK